MGWFVSDEKVPVEVDCRCPGSPHSTDTVWLRAELGPEGGYAVLRAIKASRAEGDLALLEEYLGRAYCKHGIIDWTFVDEAGEVVPCTPENIARLSWPIARPVAERGDVLYAEELLAPLVARPSASSRNGHTAPSTSARKPSTAARRKPSK